MDPRRDIIYGLPLCWCVWHSELKLWGKIGIPKSHSQVHIINNAVNRRIRFVYLKNIYIIVSSATSTVQMITS